MFERRPIWIWSLTIFSNVFGEIARWTLEKVLSLQEWWTDARRKQDFYENLAGHFYHLAYLPMTFLPSGIFTIWHFYHLAYLPMAFSPSGIFTIWHFYHLAFLPSGIFTNGIFTIWHFYQCNFYHLTFLPLAFLPSGIFTNGIFTVWHIY